MKEILEFVASTVNPNNIDFSINDEDIINKAIEIDKRILELLFHEKKGEDCVIFPYNKDLYIFSNYQGFKNEKDNGLGLLIIKNYTPELLLMIQFIGMQSADQVGFSIK